LSLVKAWSPSVMRTMLSKLFHKQLELCRYTYRCWA
jgi:hypothetical protein